MWVCGRSLPGSGMLEIVAMDGATTFKLALMRVNTKYNVKKMFPFLVVLF